MAIPTVRAYCVRSGLKITGCHMSQMACVSGCHRSTNQPVLYFFHSDVKCSVPQYWLRFITDHPSVLWRCWISDRKGIQLVKTQKHYHINSQNFIFGGGTMGVCVYDPDVKCLLLSLIWLNFMTFYAVVFPIPATQWNFA